MTNRSSRMAVPRSTYLSGAWVALTTLDVWLLVDSGPQDPLVGAVWSIMRSGTDVSTRRALLQEALTASGCSFAMITCMTDGIDISVSGNAEVGADLGDAAVRLECPSGVQLAAFHVAKLPDVVELSGGTASDHASFPIDAGVARASALSVRWSPVEAQGELQGAFPLAPVPEAGRVDAGEVTDRHWSLGQEDVRGPQRGEVTIDDAAPSSTADSEPDADEELGGTQLPGATLISLPEADLSISQVALDYGALGDSGPDEEAGTSLGAEEGGGVEVAVAVPGDKAGGSDSPITADADIANSYDELFGQTVQRSIEGAAVRAEPSPEAPSSEPRQEVVSPTRQESRASTARPEATALGSHDSVEVSRISQEPSTALPAPKTGIIDSIPWARPRAVDEAVPVEVGPQAGSFAGDSAGASDVDLTVTRAAQSALISQLGAGSLAPASLMVHAVRCTDQHANPSHATSCRICGKPVPPQDAVMVPRPILGRLRLSTGDDVVLDRAVLMGRDPAKDRHAAGERPHVVKLAGADISRSHLEVTLDEWHVLVTDLKSTNGTVVTLPGRSPERLRPGQAIMIEPGTVVTLAEEVHFTYEAI